MIKVSDNYYVSPQISEEDLDYFKNEGFSLVVCNRPNGEEDSQIDFCDYESGEKIKIPNYERAKLNPGDVIQGQCVITEDQTTIIVSNKFNTKVLSNNFLQMEYTGNE